MSSRVLVAVREVKLPVEHELARTLQTLEPC